MGWTRMNVPDGWTDDQTNNKEVRGMSVGVNGHSSKYLSNSLVHENLETNFDVGVHKGDVSNLTEKGISLG